MCDLEHSKGALVEKGNVKNSLQEPLLLGTTKGLCPVCKQIKTLLLLRYELVVCKSCLKNITKILGLVNDGVSKEELMLRFASQED
ncbi:MAG: hypothetical protein QCH99_10360 [Candidatus Bathyarchaeota archaeon]|nr:hypothetical protein [Candidatus Bathyarchaeum tardum]WGM88696.1 MAG: hypothetical protein NUK63_07170 [Candidatus Bathyarchaeum tardum]